LQRPALKCGEWQWLICRPAWDGNDSWDSFTAHTWKGPAGERVLIAVNYAPYSSQCYVELPFPEIQNCSVRFEDLLSSARYDRDGNELLGHGLYLDLKPWSYHIFTLEVN
jgi:hypothetical protein